jgi:hypothetical protein
MADWDEEHHLVAGTATALGVFIRAAELLLASSQALLLAGEASADVPLMIAAALEQARQYHVAGDPEPVLDLLNLVSPEELVQQVQALVAPWSDLNQFLAAAGKTQVRVTFPDGLVSLVVLKQLQQTLSLNPGEQEIVQLNVDVLDKRLRERAAQGGMPITCLERWQAQVMERLQTLDPQSLWHLAKTYLEEEEDLPPPPPTVAGPILYLEVSEYLLNHPDLKITPDQRLDLQINAGRAEARLNAMNRLGKIRDPEGERQLIRAWMQQHSPQDLLSYLGLWFPTQA